MLALAASTISSFRSNLPTLRAERTISCPMRGRVLGRYGITIRFGSDCVAKSKMPPQSAATSCCCRCERALPSGLPGWERLTVGEIMSHVPDLRRHLMFEMMFEWPRRFSAGRAPPCCVSGGKHERNGKYDISPVTGCKCLVVRRTSEGYATRPLHVCAVNRSILRRCHPIVSVRSPG